MSKRAVFLATSAALVAVPGRAFGQSSPKIKIGASPNGDTIGVLWGIQSGIFQRAGLDVDIQRMNNGAAVSSAVLGGSLEMGKGSLFTLISAHARGAPIVVEAPCALYHADAPDSALVVATDSPLRNPQELAGKTIAVPALGDFYAVINQAWIDRHGGDSRTMKFLELPGVAAAEAIAHGRVDAAVLVEPILSEGVKSGKCRIFGYPHEVLGPRSLSTVYFCTAEYASKNASMLARFRKALDEASAYANAHGSEMIPVVAKYTGVDPKIVATMNQNTLGAAADLLDPRLIQPTIDFAQRYKSIGKTFPAKELIDPSAFAGH
jgi:NitT/TauT family transport system substrate-binding protein